MTEETKEATTPEPVEAPAVEEDATPQAEAEISSEPVEEKEEAEKPAPKKAKPKAKAKRAKPKAKAAPQPDEEEVPDMAEAVSTMQGELGELRRRLEEKDASIEALSNQQRERLESERRRILVNQWGLRDAAYLALAPSIDQADPLTEEGRGKMIEFRNKHRALFAGSPSLPDVNVSEGGHDETAIHGRIKKFGDIFKK
jgi:hypothetical protein